MVFVVDKNKRPLSPTTNVRARILLKRGKAIVYKIYPFTIRLKESKKCDSKYTIKLDPGANITGGAIVDKEKALFFFEIVHRGKQVKKLLDKRRAIRRSRRFRKTRYRKPRFLNRTRPDGWLAPSVKSRADNIINIVNKFAKLIPLTDAAIEKVSFDTSKITANKKLYGAQYQNGTLKDTKLRKYIFKKYDNQCGYCGSKDNLEIEHIVPKSKGGTNSVKNITLSCRKCNELKSNMSLKQFGKLINKDLSHLEPNKTPKSAAIIQSARNYTIEELSKKYKVTTGEGWETKLNREELNLPKEHYYDALCIGKDYKYKIQTDEVFIIKAEGRGSRQMCRMDRFGFPRTSAKQSKLVYGFQTGDIVKAIVTKGKKEGLYFGKVAVRSSGNFNITTANNTVQGINYKYCTLVQKADGYSYQNLRRKEEGQFLTA